MKRTQFLFISILFLFLCNIEAQVDDGDCPGSGYATLTETHYYWYWDGILGAGTNIYNSSGKMDQEDAVVVVEQHIQSCFNKWKAATNDNITFSRSTSFEDGMIKIVFKSINPDYGYFMPYETYWEIQIDTRDWSDYEPLVSQYPDLYSTILHEICHFMGYPDSHAATTSVIKHEPQLYKRSLTPCDIATTLDLYDDGYTVHFNNFFETGMTGDSMIVNGDMWNLDSNGWTENWHLPEGDIYLEAVDGQTGYYYRLFRNWNQSTSLTNKRRDLPKEDAQYIAYFDKRFKIKFYNGSVTIDSQVYEPEEVYYNRENEPLTATANSKIENSMYCVLDQWKNGAYSLGSDNPKTFSPINNMNYTIEYKYDKPVNTYRNLSFNDGQVGQNVVITWNKHPLDSNGITKYEIWQKIRRNGVTGSESKIGTVFANNSSTYNYTDLGCIIATDPTTILYYDVKAYYSTTGKTSDNDYLPVYGEVEANIVNGDSYESADSETALAEEAEQKKETTLGNFPNPFNPTTNINYTLAETGYVSLKVYDVLGKEMVTLVNEVKNAGQHSVQFNASHLPSGIYIYTLQTNAQAITSKMLLMK